MTHNNYETPADVYWFRFICQPLIAARAHVNHFLIKYTHHIYNNVFCSSVKWLAQAALNY